MTNEETAIKFGVCLPETAKKLDWQKPTVYAYDFLSPEDCRFPIHETVRETEGERDRAYVFAPQVHELAHHLPYEFKIGNNIFKLARTISIMEDAEILFENKSKKRRLFNSIVKYDTTADVYHYAEAYAQLYIKLREAGLLGKEVSNE